MVAGLGIHQLELLADDWRILIECATDGCKFAGQKVLVYGTPLFQRPIALGLLVGMVRGDLGEGAQVHAGRSYDAHGIAGGVGDDAVVANLRDGLTDGCAESFGETCVGEALAQPIW